MVFLVFNQNNRFRAVDINHAVCAELQKIYQMSSLFRVIAPNVKISVSENLSTSFQKPCSLCNLLNAVLKRKTCRCIL